MAKTKKKNNVLVILAVLLIGISIGYAAFSQALTINGTANANGNFKLEFTNAVIDTNVGANNSTAVISATGDTLSVNMNLEYPGSGATIKTTITNTGTIAAKLNDIKFTGIDDQNIKVSFAQLTKNEVIEPKQTKEILITVKWDDSSSTATKLTFSATLDYEQSTTNFVEIPSQSEENI